MWKIEHKIKTKLENLEMGSVFELTEDGNTPTMWVMTDMVEPNCDGPERRIAVDMSTNCIGATCSFPPDRSVICHGMLKRWTIDDSTPDPRLWMPQPPSMSSYGWGRGQKNQ